MSLTITSAAGKRLTNTWLAMSEITRTSSEPVSLLFFKFKWLHLFCTTWYPHIHIFLQTKKFCCPLLRPVLGGLPVERQGRTLVKQGLRLSGFNPQLYLRLLWDQLYPVVLVPHLSSEDNSAFLTGGGEDQDHVVSGAIWGYACLNGGVCFYLPGGASTSLSCCHWGADML